MGPIQTLPQGLLGLLQLKQQGSNPSQFVDAVQGTFELFDMYAQSRLLDVSGANAAAPSPKPAVNVNTAGAKGFGANGLIVPQGQIWYVYQYTLQCSLLAAEYIRFAPVLYPAPGSLDIVTLGPDYNDVITARARFALVGNTAPFWATSGASLGFAVYDIVTGGNINVTANMRAAVMQL